VRFGDFRRLAPISRHFGYDRGQPIDRHYIEEFIASWAGDIRGHVLEIGDDTYTRRYGDHVSASDVLHVSAGHPGVTIVADLTNADHLPAETFDCIILTQTLQFIYDVRAAIATLHRILRPDGVLLATVPGITPLDAGDWRDSWYWGFTDRAVAGLFGEAFPPSRLTIGTHGNVLAAIAFLQGLASAELEEGELAHLDAQYPVLITVRAVKPNRASP
jgi:SAM-dependent methyltransferase